MKYVINRSYGTFKVPAELCNKYGYFEYDESNEMRTNPTLINYLEKNKDAETSLVIMDIPDRATDWELSSYDGYEYLTVVVDGKIVHIRD